MTEIVLKNVSIEFPIYHASARSFKKHLIHLSTGGKLLNAASKTVVVKALDNVSLEIQHGDRVGLIGHNGAGKSTLLRVLSRIYEPTSGQLRMEGKASPLLDLMFGIEPESTGYENIVTRGMLLGLTRKEINERIPSIAEFTGLGDYLYMPTRTYSAGMQLRLAFGVATSIAPEILVLDEVVGTGDLNFLEKAKGRLNELIQKSSIVILATHSLDMIKDVCNKVILLKEGRLEFMGDVAEGIEKYQAATTLI
jgi:ABC-2 type transport system ATP-binding protein